MAFNSLAVKENAAVAFIIHRGPKNEKVKGYLKIVEDKALGKQWLVGEQITGLYQVRGEMMETKKQVRIEITGLSITRL